ncbi:MAG: hypothetical protein KUA43_08250 [Hoeflea sp.]|uniref:hypothetical protein n=1 Tax=Hoeflea sp. TaxID=1940281 RepID=UPI001D42489C|nr:hypothetical protein [Hoeflea sp.]MBU4528952.1 hypothetical protein [Alphaproteobacteria bacterium]MBU4544085.1 hypothetical protein [Alphaproteobacteria bacterium]MBU4551954.1 hypothetical protein [Alphaproteobacteria bacterium]MBV1723419.1 hypothetical protein [Hoeflea sp.]MBV1760398.1 hypothetical protein [Hoeflea sp.]
MAASRAQKLARLTRVQRQIERMTENELSHILREQASADATQDALVEAIGSFDPVHAAMSHQYALRFQRLSARAQQLSGMKAVQEKRVLIEKTKADRLAEQAEEAAGDEERLAADESLLDLLEASLGAKPGGTRPA